MKLTTFLKQRNLALSKKALKLCKIAIGIYKRSQDPLHNLSHIENILDNLDRLLNLNPRLSKKIEFEELILSIYWHDSWRAKRNKGSLFNTFYEDIFDGMGSANLFNKYASKHLLNTFTAQKVFYNIRKHSTIQFLPAKTLEAKILQDLDEMEFWNYERLKKSNIRSNLIKNALRIFYKTRDRRRLNNSELEPMFKKTKLNLLDNL